MCTEELANDLDKSAFSICPTAKHDEKALLTRVSGQAVAHGSLYEAYEISVIRENLIKELSPPWRFRARFEGNGGGSRYQVGWPSGPELSGSQIDRTVRYREQERVLVVLFR
jgi:hypothetical protein